MAADDRKSSAATTESETTYSVQWRCPKMDRHDSGYNALERPCPDCYSVLVTSTRIPYRENVGWTKEPIHV